MEPTDLLQGIFAKYPFLAVIGPLVGFIMARVKSSGKLQGFALLWTAFAVSVAVTGAYGLAEAWTVEAWRKAPLAVIVILAFSQLTAQTTLHVQDVITKSNDDGT
jgi:hypothetical protein